MARPRLNRARCGRPALSLRWLCSKRLRCGWHVLTVRPPPSWQRNGNATPHDYPKQTRQTPRRRVPTPRLTWASRLVSPDSTAQARLLIRRFRVRVPGGAPQAHQTGNLPRLRSAVPAWGGGLTSRFAFVAANQPPPSDPRLRGQMLVSSAGTSGSIGAPPRPFGSSS